VKVVTASIVFIYECTTGSATVTWCMGCHHISLVMEGILHSEVIFNHFILINYSKTGGRKFRERICHSQVCAIVCTWDT
jgi:hypothetical protein